MKQFQIEYIIQHIDAVTVLLPHNELVGNPDMTLPAVGRQTKATNGNDGRHKAHNESGYQSRKRTEPDTPHSISVQKIVHEATFGSFLMAKYKGVSQQSWHFGSFPCTTFRCVAGANNSTATFQNGTRVTPKHFRPFLVTRSVAGFNKSLTTKRKKKLDGRRTAPIVQNDQQVEYLQVRCLLTNECRQLKVMNILDAVTDGVDEVVAKGQHSLNGTWKAPVLVEV